MTDYKLHGKMTDHLYAHAEKNHQASKEEKNHRKKGGAREKKRGEG